MRLSPRRCGWHPLGHQKSLAQEPGVRFLQMSRPVAGVWSIRRSDLRLGHQLHSAASRQDFPRFALRRDPHRRRIGDRFAWLGVGLVQKPGRLAIAAAANRQGRFAGSPAAPPRISASSMLFGSNPCEVPACIGAIGASPPALTRSDLRLHLRAGNGLVVDGLCRLHCADCPVVPMKLRPKAKALMHAGHSVTCGRSMPAHIGGYTEIGLRFF